MMSRAARWFLGGAVLVGVASCGGIPDSILEQGRERRLKAAGVETFDSTGSHELAGMSATRIIEIEPIDVRSLGVDMEGEEYKAFHARCSACHAAPTPDDRPAFLWPGVLKRMSENQLEAGLMPMSATDKARVLEFLERHAKGNE